MLCVAILNGFFSPEHPRQKIGGQPQGSVLQGQKAGMGTKHWHFAGTLRAVLEGHYPPPQGPQRTIKWLFATWHLDGSLRAAVQFLILSHLLYVMQSWCQTVEQLPFSSSWACPSLFVCSGSPWNSTNLRPFCTLLSPYNLHLAPQPASQASSEMFLDHTLPEVSV